MTQPLRMLPAAAIPLYAVVRLPETDFDFTLHIIENATPRPGLITWYDEMSFEYEIPATTKVEIVSLP